jgi:4-diphosphocytidyl-2-C-methyl-D-erythritol kinase
MTIRRASLRSLAKVNLDLRVLNRRPDGYHELRTVFQTISLADTIEIEYQAARRTDLTIEDELAIPGNLVLRAAQAILEETGRTARVHFRLKKRIPMGGGLGGGSSNAATVLLGLPVLAGCKIPFARLQEIAGRLGSDVPFFLLGGTALGLARGEEVYPLPEVKPAPILLVSCGLHVSTPQAYQDLKRGLTLPDSSSRINDFQAFVRALADGRPARQASALSANDFEPVVFRQYPQLQTIADQLSRVGPRWGGGKGRFGAGPGNAAAVRMTGSGSAIFAIYDSRAERAHALSELNLARVLPGCKTALASLVSRSAYRRLWWKQLRQHVLPDTSLWPPQSRYER